MGLAKIIGGGPDGRYTVNVDYGQASRAANIAALDTQEAKLAAKQREAEAKYKEANDAYQAQRTGYVNALNTAIEFLNSAMLFSSTAQILAEANAIKASAQTKYDEAAALHATRLAELQAARGALSAATSSLASGQQALVQAQADEAQALEALAAAQNAVAVRETERQAQQQQTAAAEAAYAAALASGVGVEEARQVMQAQQTQLANTLQALAAETQTVQDRQADLVPLTAARVAAEAAVASLVSQKADAQDQLDLAVVAEQLALANKQVATAEMERATAAAAAILAQPSFDSALAAAKQNVLAAQAQLAQLDAANAPLVLELKRTVTGIKMARAQLADMRQRWVDAEMVETKTVWCVDLTESATGDVATVDINGESTLTLLAPGCRAWQAGDGTISLARKAAGAARLQARLSGYESKVTALTAEIATQQAKADALKATLDSLQAQYNAAGSESRPALGLRVSAAAGEWQDQVAVVSAVKLRRVDAQARVAEAAQALLEWNNQPASDEPNPGDGALLHPVAQSPWQSFVNLAIHPGWQRHMPTYRWGTALFVDEDRNTMDVQLAPATSSVQGLDINQATVLRQVPVEYMTCNASVFEKDDRVVVRFKGQDWTRPVVIGFLDNPKSCVKYGGFFAWGSEFGAYPREVIRQEKHKNRFWDPVESPFPRQPYPFLRWTDGVKTRRRENIKVTGFASATALYFEPDECQIFSSSTVYEITSAEFIVTPPPPNVILWPGGFWRISFKRTIVFVCTLNDQYAENVPGATIVDTANVRWDGQYPAASQGEMFMPFRDPRDIWPEFTVTFTWPLLDGVPHTVRYGLRTYGVGAFYVPLETHPFNTG